MASALKPACTPCFRRDVDEFAANFCKVCSQYYCKSCLDYHDKIFGVNDHEMVSVSSLGSETSGPSDKESRKEMCRQHPTEAVSLYCYPHDSVFCQVCKTNKHRDCIGVEFIAQACQHYTKTELSNANRQELETVLRKLIHIKALRQKDQQRIETEKQTIITSIRDFKQRVLELLDKIEREAFEEVQRKFYTLQEKISMDDMTCDQVIYSTEHLLQLYADGTQEEGAFKMFIFDKMSHATVSHAHQVATSLETNVGQASIQVNLDTHIEEDLKHMSLIKVNDEKGKELQATFKEDAVIHPTVVKGPEKNQHLVKTSSDEHKCSIKGICQLDTGWFIMIDWQNHNVKVFDDMFNFVNVTPIGEWPSSVCQSGPGEVSVGMEYYMSGAIIRLSLENQPGRLHLVKKSKLKMKHYCLGLTYSDGQYYVADLSGKLYAYDRNGKCLRVVYKGQTIKDIKLSCDSETIFVSDEFTGLVLLNRLGTEICTVPSSKIKRSSGLAADMCGGVFVSDSKYMNVFHVDSTGSHVSPALLAFDASEDIKKPRALCYDVLKNRLIVSFSDRDFIEVLQLTTCR